MTEKSETPVVPLIKKMGFLPKETIYVEDTPAWYSAFASNNELELAPSLPANHVHLFCSNRDDLAEFLKANELQEIEKSLWLSWPKKTQAPKNDVGEEYFRNVILPLGWVDTKVAAIDDIWSGLKFVRRKD